MRFTVGNWKFLIMLMHFTANFNKVQSTFLVFRCCNHAINHFRHRQISNCTLPFFPIQMILQLVTFNLWHNRVRIDCIRHDPMRMREKVEWLPPTLLCCFLLKSAYNGKNSSKMRNCRFRSVGVKLRVTTQSIRIRLIEIETISSSASFDEKQKYRRVSIYCVSKLVDFCQPKTNRSL